VLECLTGMILLPTLKQRDTTANTVYSEQHVAVVMAMSAAKQHRKAAQYNVHIHYLRYVSDHCFPERQHAV
jgi:hypothetical protein